MAYIEAIVNNPKNKLLPGMFADVTVFLPTHQKVIVLPHTAINYSSYGNSVYLITPSKKKDRQGKPILRANMKTDSLGEKRGNKVIIFVFVA